MAKGKRAVAVLFLLSLLAICLPVAGEAGQLMQYFRVQSGTGFFVNRQYVITNAHVIKGCENVIIKGAVRESAARVKVQDDANDLALLETEQSPQQFAPLRFNIDDLKPGDKVLLLGYPGEAGLRGEFSMATAQIQDMHEVVGSPPGWFYITDVVEHGNSGGPVFDTSGNVIGVVVAKSNFIYTLASNPQQTISEKHVGAVIGLATLKQFLFNQGVYTEWLGSNLLYADSTIEDNAKGYIVNVQCRIPVDSAAAAAADPQQHPAESDNGR